MIVSTLPLPTKLQTAVVKSVIFQICWCLECILKSIWHSGAKSISGAERKHHRYLLMFNIAAVTDSNIWSAHSTRVGLSSIRLQSCEMLQIWKESLLLPLTDLSRFLWRSIQYTDILKYCAQCAGAVSLNWSLSWCLRWTSQLYFYNVDYMTVLV